MNQPVPGHIYIITGPSGVGKGTLCKMLLAVEPNLTLSISATSRAMRAGETDGVSYHFKTRDAFEAMIAHDQAQPDAERHHLLEWAEYNGNYYGTPRSVVQEALAAGSSVLLEIETQGALQVKRKFPSAHLIFVAPPSLEALAYRLRTRGTEAEAEIASRLEISRHEMTLQDQFDYVLVNERLETCLDAIREIMAGTASGRTLR
ncbi:guanylate kinase [Vampirovibrio chlorellavorus]|uniref:guanylate kinase n=1 Tax=Vampirovibrio chlorellavorus TaxID=758823 RepID=UPI0026F27939|nr:guanylate kinase [Vampirovibrio chlorellavorus]